MSHIKTYQNKPEPIGIEELGQAVVISGHFPTNLAHFHEVKYLK